MELSTLDIILIVIAVALAIALLYSIVKRKKLILQAVRRNEIRYNTQLREAESEIRRLAIINKDLNEQLEAPKRNSFVPKGKASQLIDTEALVVEQKKLELQQRELTDRNKMLWDMSLSIEKERKHIQELKNDIERQHKSVTDSIRYAKLIQNAVLPSKEILKESFQDVFLFWRPKNIVSGDFYWMKRIGDTVIFTVADCTGHGVPGAFMSMLGVAFLNEISVETGAEATPAQILEEMRCKIIATLRQTTNPLEPKDGMDMAICVLNLKTMKMLFAGADNGMYLVRGTELMEYKPVKNPVAIYPRMKDFQNCEIDVQHGDYIYMFSDGYQDQLNDGRSKFTSRRFRELLVNINAKTKVASEQADLLNAAIEEWRGDQEQLDDILVGGYCIG
ncbi:MAG: SpoIIE family protein phosphatase [Bacteroidales bacterium]|nr:SpoIIE family protein phosphatase [Bacteroidales bacterium]MBR3713212.1 SpoIIE family protein phosphatase [Bacteroidales bacterium]